MVARDRKSTRLNSSHTVISYAVFCLKKKKKNKRYDSNEKKTIHITIYNSDINTSLMYQKCYSLVCDYYIRFLLFLFLFFFFFNDTATTEIYTLSLHDALPISRLRLTSQRVSCRALASAS